MPWVTLGAAAIKAGGDAAASPAPPSGIFSSPLSAAPSFAGGGVWNVATSGSRASNSGSASNALGAAGDEFSKYLPLALGGLALVIAWKLLKK